MGMLQNYPSHLSGLATSCPPSTRPAPPLSMSASLTTEEVKDLIYEETIRYGEQQISETEMYLDQHQHARGNDWRICTHVNNVTCT